jgi:hypothetical protein
MDRAKQFAGTMRTVQDGWWTVCLEGEHTVVHGGETGGDMLVIP